MGRGPVAESPAARACALLTNSALAALKRDLATDTPEGTLSARNGSGCGREDEAPSEDGARPRSLLSRSASPW